MNRALIKQNKDFNEGIQRDIPAISRWLNRREMASINSNDPPQEAAKRFVPRRRSLLLEQHQCLSQRSYLCPDG
ncbi:MAG: hypothetical protein ACTXOO_05860 [Sodalis sp. (in: enterobacteria)]